MKFAMRKALPPIHPFACICRTHTLQFLQNFAKQCHSRLSSVDMHRLIRRLSQLRDVRDAGEFVLLSLYVQETPLRISLRPLLLRILLDRVKRYDGHTMWRRRRWCPYQDYWHTVVQ